ncbi:integrase catalytic domain-containing protein [Nephila pilipes]|uniref:Integrase catalytic domain-containing protein n=1 Tax=Nephila pilipes TaxID=299642 RepID=A0A8X6N3P2_NEPPI|nr:integrase catalytic domain-containing protein [Nephila pilipes]
MAVERKDILKGVRRGNCKSCSFGGIEQAEKFQIYNINLSNADGSCNCELVVLDDMKICASLPRMNDDNCLKQLKDLGILISDGMINEKSCLYEKNSGEINLLIGADYSGKLLTGNVKHLSGSLVAIHTLLGWTVMDTVGIHYSTAKRSKTETQQLAMKHSRETISRDNIRNTVRS